MSAQANARGNWVSLFLGGALMILVTAVLSGCGSSATVDTSKFSTAFATADKPVRIHVEAVVSAVEAADFPSALAKLRQLTQTVQLSSEQKNVSESLSTELQKQLVSMLQSAAGEADEMWKHQESSSGGNAASGSR